MNAATNPAADQRSPVEKSSDPSMEEILASIRRIIADEQQAAATPRQEIRAVPAVEPAASAGPVPARNDNEFEAWLAQTANGQPPGLRPSIAHPAEAHAAEAHTAEAHAAEADAAAPVVQAEHAAAPAAAAPAVMQDPEPPQAEIVPLRQPEVQVVQQPPVYEPPPVQPVQVHYEPVYAAVEPAVQAPRLTVVSDTAAAYYQPQETTYAAVESELDAPLTGSGEPEGLLSAAAGNSVQSAFQALAQTMFMQKSGMVDEAVSGMLQPMLKQWLDDNLPSIVERLVRAEIERVARGGR